MGVTQRFTCTLCGTKYSHDKAYTHFVTECQKKERANKAKGA